MNSVAFVHPGEGFESGFASAAPSVVTVTATERTPLAMRIKRLVQSLFVIPALPTFASFSFNARLFGTDRAFLGASEQISRWAGNLGVYVRQAFYERTLLSCGRDVYFGHGCLFAMPTARVGDRAYIGRRVSIGLADIGEEAMLADGVQVLSGGNEHTMATSHDESHQSQPQQFRRVCIGKGAWIGTNAVIMADVGARSVIGAGAVVTKPIPPDSVAVGVPAKVIRAHTSSANV